MGQDKASLRWQGAPLLTHVLRAVCDCASDVVVVAREGQSLPRLPAGVRRVHDPVEDLGPLGGLGIGLATIEDTSAYVTSCDVPWLRRSFVHALQRAHAVDAACAITVVREAAFFHPLAGVYDASVGPAIEAALARGERRPRTLFDVHPTRVIEAEMLRPIDPELLSLRNVNTAEALDAVPSQPPDIRVELFESARHVAGTTHVWVPGHTVTEALAGAAALLPALVPDVLHADGTPAKPWRVALDGAAILTSSDTRLREGASLVLINPLAGG